MKNIVVVTPARSGSCWLMNCLEKVAGYPEYVPLFEGTVHPDWQQPVEDKVKTVLQHQPYILKILTDEIVPLEHFKENTEYVWLDRTNIPEHFLSYVMALTTRTFNIHVGETYTPPNELEIKQEHIEFMNNILECKNRVYKQYKNWFTYHLTYETMFNNNPWGFKNNDYKHNTIKLNHHPQQWIDQATEICKQQNWI